MKTLFAFAAAAALAAAFTAPAFADAMAADKMSCKDFGAMDSAGMMKATTEMKMALPKDSMEAKMADDKAMEKVMAGCKGHDDMMAIDAMHPKM